MARVRAGKPHALNAVHRATRASTRGKVARRIVGRLIVVDDLSEQLNLAMPLTRRLSYFVEDVALRAHPLVAARVRHHAERAELVAAFDDRDPRPHRIAMPDDAERERHVVVRIDVDAWTSRCARIVHQRRQLLQALRAEHDVDRAIAFEQRRAFLLRDAAGDGDDRALGLARRGLAQLAKSRVELVLGARAHCRCSRPARRRRARVRRAYSRRARAGLPGVPSHGSSSGTRRCR